MNHQGVNDKGVENKDDSDEGLPQAHGRVLVVGAAGAAGRIVRVVVVVVVVAEEGGYLHSIKNPKSEGRNPKEIRNPKSENEFVLPAFRNSQFELPSSFVIWHSSFI
jgi:hypothetical protein